MINVLVGTKGQLIKMAPIMKEMDRRGIEYNFINANQHTKILDEISKLFELKKPDFVLEGFEKDITNVREMLWWGSKNVWECGLSKKHRIFLKDKNTNILLVHGDAPPALLGLVLGKLNKLKIAHIEAGLRSRNIFQPFPEELIRIIVDKKLKKNNIRIDKIYYCPHYPKDNCLCRKPKIGMLLKAVKDFDISLNESWVIGDDERDIIMARNANVKSIKVGKKMPKN